MKKISITLLAFAAAVLAASCQKEEVRKGSAPMTISAVTEGIEIQLTKAEMAYKYDVIWNVGDKICIKNSGESAEFTLTDGAGTTKGTFTSSTSISGDVEAYYPASVANLVWPSVQRNNEVCPMYCTKNLSSTENQTFNFSSLGSVLQIVFNSTQPDIILKSIEIKDGEKTMSGAFHVDGNGQAIIDATDNAGITLDLGEGKSLGKGANYFNIAVPTNSYTDLTLVFTATDGTKCTMTNGKVNIAYNTVGRLTLTGEEFKSDVPEGALPGKFSVSDTKKVHFSQGNLTYNVSTTTWAFYEHQYDCATGYDSNLISLFTWGYDATKSIDPDGTSYVNGHKTGGESFNKNEDWGYVFGGESSVWRTLTKDEWTYLFNTTGRMVNGKPCYSNAVSGVTIGSATYKGVFLYPDNYNGEVVSSGSMTWDQINAAGIVFLPAAGYRSGSEVGIVGDLGCYWSSTAYDSVIAYSVTFDGADVYPANGDNRCGGVSVRLITECQ